MTVSLHAKTGTPTNKGKTGTPIKMMGAEDRDTHRKTGEDRDTHK